jgi:hypothetical protein
MRPGVVVGRTTALRLLHCHGARARASIKEKVEAAVATAGREGRRVGIAALEVEYDGGMVPVATFLRRSRHLRWWGA